MSIHHPATNQRIEAKMQGAGIAAPTIQAFLGAVERVRSGDRGLIPEADIEPIATLPEFEGLPPAAGDAGLMRQLAVIKLNGGLGTGMGLDRAKSLLPVRDGATFLDFIARQILHLRGGRAAAEPAFYLMDSFSTQADTLEYLAKYPELPAGGPLDFLQSKVPKLEAATLEPVSWPANPELEWCPPGHGDIYPALLGCGLMERMLSNGIRFLFVSNSDNLGATVEPKLLRYFADSKLSFLMEVCQRTAADSKGGHLARRRSSGRLLLRESAQCPKPDEAAFQDIARHQFFNTNNLWIQLEHLRDALEKNHGAIPLPIITNSKTVDPRDAKSIPVLQLESAMGAAIECFDHSGAVRVPRSRFSPVKTTADLLALRSDAYRVTADHRLVLEDSRGGQPPLVQLDPAHYKGIADFDAAFADGAPSLIRCRSIKVAGKLQFARGVVCEGAVQFSNASSEAKKVPGGVYRDQQAAL